MREKRTVIDKHHGFTKNSKDLNSIEFMINPLGVVINASSKDELISKLLEYFPEEETYMYDNPHIKRVIAVETNRENIKHYIDGYSSISIMDKHNSASVNKRKENSIVISGSEYEINKLTSALSRNCIKVARFKTL